MIKNCIVKYEDCITPEYRHWSKLMDIPATPSRKQWEDVMIAQALYERGMLQPGKIGIGFGVGRERMVSLFASLGCTILATDQALTSESLRDWRETGQHSSNSGELHYPGICDRDAFYNNVSFDEVDMNHIPNDYNDQFDFAYSACSLDHLGSLNNSMDFIENSLKCLKPGGWAVHTTEFNLYAAHPEFDGKTTEVGSTVFFRRSDIEYLTNRLHSKGYIVEDTDYLQGPDPKNYDIDFEPHSNPHHLVLQVCTGPESGGKGWIVTSIIFIAQRPLCPPL